MRQILNAMRREAASVLGDVALPSVGVIRSYNPNKSTVRLELQPQGTLTGWIPLLTAWSGNGWGMFCAPTIGDLVQVTFLNGDIDSGVASLRLFNDQDVPLPVPSGEFWLQHKSGAFFKLTNDGKATFTDGKGATISMNGNGTITSSAVAWAHAGPIAIAGSVTVTGGNVTADGIGLKTHTHTDPQGGATGAPQ